MHLIHRRNQLLKKHKQRIARLHPGRMRSNYSGVKRHVLKLLDKGADYHAKPYRKRHLLSLATTFVLVVFLFSMVTWFVSTTNGFRRSANQSFQQMTPVYKQANTARVVSSLGFEFAYDPNEYAVQASEALTDGSINIDEGSEITDGKPYNVVQITRQKTSGVADPAQLLFIADSKELDSAQLKRRFGELNAEQLITKQYEDAPEGFVVSKLEESKQYINSREYLKTAYTNTPTVGSKGGLKLSKTRTTLYADVFENRPFVIKVSGQTEGLSSDKPFQEIIDSFTIVQNKNPNKTVESRRYIDPTTAANELTEFQRNRMLGEWLIGSHMAGAADDRDLVRGQAYIVAQYAPATVRIYSILCGTIMYRNTSLGYECGGSTGTGFLVSSDGYIATNGHVVSTSVENLVAESIMFDDSILRRLLSVEGYESGQIDQVISALKKEPDMVGAVAQAIYSLPKDHLLLKNENRQHIVALGSDQPDLQKIIDAKEPFKDNDTVKRATLKAIDYNYEDLLNGAFTKSDVALLKLEGQNYPIVNVGTIDTLVQGSTLTVVGFPGVAENQLIDTSKIQASATSGLVSAIRNSNDGKKRMVQSDVKIGHGNSGGPAFDDSGKAIGLATYFYSGKNTGDGDLTYVRDIKDVLDLAHAKQIKLVNDSATQDLWEKGLDQFFSARYTPAIATFKKVVSLYPAHSLAIEYQNIAYAKIKAGEEARSGWVLAAFVFGLTLSIAGMVVSALTIYRHHQKHRLYLAAVAVGSGAPAETPPHDPLAELVMQPVQQFRNVAETIIHHAPSPFQQPPMQNVQPQQEAPAPVSHAQPTTHSSQPAHRRSHQRRYIA